jgi:putative membrane protein insertion efficiency factor
VNAVQHILILGVRLYRWGVSPAKLFLFGPLGGCRFTPTCSEYAIQAVARHGALAGSWLALKRLGRCHPWGGCGEDPVPQQGVSPYRAAANPEPSAPELKSTVRTQSSDSAPSVSRFLSPFSSSPHGS